VGGGNGDLVALDLESGKLRWKYTTGNLIGESSPAVGTGAVYVGDLGGLLHAVNLADGKRLWTFKTASEIKSSPVIVDDAVLVGSYDGYLYAVDAKTGQQKWKFQTNGMVHATPAVQNGLAFIAGCDSMLRAILPDRLWRLHRRVSAHRRHARLFRHVQQRGAGLRPPAAPDALAVCRSGPPVPLLFLCGPE
jgi:outer membrane protein assembly factor BamB